MTARHIAVIDVGKTNAKLALVDADGLTEIAVVSRPNTVLPGPPYPHFDVDGHWGFFLDALARFHSDHGVGAVSVTTHGASGALIGADGCLAAPVLDYEHPGPDTVAGDYDMLRPAFSETGSPRLRMGLNLGAQIHWQFMMDPDLRDRTDTIVTYPQYWGHRLTGVSATDVSSLGAHTDLWNPHKRCFSSLVERMEIADKMAPARKSDDILGSLLPEIVDRTGLPHQTPVHCGIHDSNASLLPHVLHRKPPFSVVSTGTWVIVMTIGGSSVVLDPTRDALINVNALGAPVPSARFMGGREFEMISEGRTVNTDERMMARVISDGIMLMPAVVPESGPFQGRRTHWRGAKPRQGSPTHAVALGFYLAMMTAECLSLTGHRGNIVIEGPFCENAAYIAMLSTATESKVITSKGATGTSQGAAMLALDLATPQLGGFDGEVASMPCPELMDYAGHWRNAARAISTGIRSAGSDPRGLVENLT